MKIEFTAIVPSENNQVLFNTYSVFSLLGTIFAEVSDPAEQLKIRDLKPDTKYNIIIEEIK